MAEIHTLPEKWLPVAIVPSDMDLEVCVIDAQGAHVLAFPCRRSGTEWVDASTNEPIDIQPTHWRKWTVIP